MEQSSETKAGERGMKTDSISLSLFHAERSRVFRTSRLFFLLHLFSYLLLFRFRSSSLALRSQTTATGRLQAQPQLQRRCICFCPSLQPPRYFGSGCLLPRSSCPCFPSALLLVLLLPLSPPPSSPSASCAPWRVPAASSAAAATSSGACGLRRGPGSRWTCR